MIWMALPWEILDKLQAMNDGLPSEVAADFSHFVGKIFLQMEKPK